MANICRYKMIIRGTKDDCHACCYALDELGGCAEYDESKFDDVEDDEECDEEEYDEENNDDEEDDEEYDEEEDDEFEIYVEGECNWGIDPEGLESEYNVDITCNFVTEDDSFSTAYYYGEDFDVPECLQFEDAEQSYGLP